MDKNEMAKLNFKLVIIVFIALSAVVFSTKYYGSTDIGDYADTSKFFAGEYKAKLRSSHSYLLGIVHAPLFKIFKSFIIFKLTNLLIFALMIYLIYILSGKNIKVLWLMLFSPVIWYMAPWINPIQIASLFFFLAYFFIKKFNESEKMRFLFFSGVLVGLAWAFWDAVIFFSFLFAISFLYNKKLYHFICFFLFVLIGLSPKLIADQIIFNFAFMGILRYFSGILSSVFFNGLYGNIAGSISVLSFISLIFFIPLFSYKLYSKSNWIENKKLLIFLSLSFLLILNSLQIRYTLMIIPIIIFELGKKLSRKQFQIQLIASALLIPIIVFPYFLQINNSTNAEEFNSLLLNINNITLSKNKNLLLQEDLKNIEKDFSNEAFLVGNNPDDYQILAHLYSGNQIKEFISIQDYHYALENKTSFFEKKFMPVPLSYERRQIWIAGGISKNENDLIDYHNITLAIGVNNPIEAKNFALVKRYNSLYVSKKLMLNKT